MAQLALSVVGAVVGNALLPGLGASLGWAAGSIAGAALFPETIQGPKLADVHGQISSYGAPIGRIWGTMRTGANIVWPPGDSIYTTHEQTSSGKGGPKVVTQSRTATFRTVICRSNGSHRVLRIWAYGELIYDARTGTVVTGAELPFVFYDGAADQAVDPTEESITGAGLVPAYRGVLSMVATDWDVTKWGSIPQLNFEVSGALDEQPLSRSATWTVITPAAELTDHRSVGYDEDGNVVVAWWITNGAISNYTTINEVAVWRTLTYDVDGTLLSTVDVTHNFGGGGNIFLCRNEPTLSFHRITGVGNANASRWYKDGVMVIDQPVDMGGGVGNTFYGGMDAEFVYDPATENVFAIGGDTTDRYLIRYPAPGAVPSVNGDARTLIGTGIGQHSLTLGVDGYIYVAGDNRLRKYDTNCTLVQTWGPTGVPLGPNRFPGNLATPANGKFMICGNGDKYLALHDTDSSPLTSYEFRLYQMADSLEEWTELARVAVSNSGNVQHGPIWSLGDGMALVEDGVISVCFVDAAPTTLADIVSAVHDECGHAEADDYDVSELPDPVRGFGMFEVMTGRSAIESLMPLWAFDATQYDGKIHYIKRGHQSVVTIPDSDLSGRGENEEIPDKLQTIRGNDDELMVQHYFKYFSAVADYQIGTQQWRRTGTNSKIVRTTNAPAVFTDAEAKQRADWLGENAWNDRTAYRFSTTRKYLRITPCDVVTVRGIPLHIRKVSEKQAEGVMVFEGVRSRATLYVNSGVGGEPEGFVPQEIPEPQDTELALIDGPFIGDDWRHGQIPVIAQGALRRSWRGMSLQKSLDGTNYAELITETVPGTIGETLTALPNFGGPSFDEASVLSVLIHPGGGELVSVTRQQALAGMNDCMVGAERLIFRTATLVEDSPSTGREYALTGLLRGQYGTQWAMRGHAIGDRFVMLPSASTLPLLRSDIGISRNYKAVTSGRTLASATAYPFRSNGIPLAPYAPRFLRSGFDGDGNMLLEFDRQSRVGSGDLCLYAPTGEGAPLGEDSEAYRVRIWEDGTYQTVVRTVTVRAGVDFAQGDRPRFTYTPPMQTADFGGPLSSPAVAWSVAQIGSLGPGYETFANGLTPALPLIVPDSVPGYVPPNPSPDDSILTIIPWLPGQGRFYSGQMNQNDRWTVQTTTGNTDSIFLVMLTGAEWQSGTSPRRWALSMIRGDLVGTFAAPFSRGSGTTTVTAGFTVGAHAISGFPQVPFNTTIYLNIANESSGYEELGMFVELLNVP